MQSPGWMSLSLPPLFFFFLLHIYNYPISPSWMPLLPTPIICNERLQWETNTVIILLLFLSLTPSVSLSVSLSWWWRLQCLDVCSNAGDRGRVCHESEGEKERCGKAKSSLLNRDVGCLSDIVYTKKWLRFIFLSLVSVAESKWSNNARRKGNKTHLVNVWLVFGFTSSRVT